MRTSNNQGINSKLTRIAEIRILLLDKHYIHGSITFKMFTFQYERMERIDNKIYSNWKKEQKNIKPSYNDHHENCQCEDCQDILQEYNQRNSTSYVSGHRL